MKLHSTFTNIKNVFNLDKSSIYFSNVQNKFFEFITEGYMELPFEGEFLRFWNNYIIFQGLNGDKLNFYNQNLKLIRHSDNCYHWTFILSNNYISIHKKVDGVRYCSIFDNELNETIIRDIDYKVIIGHSMYHICNQNIKCCNLISFIKWEINPFQFDEIISNCVKKLYDQNKNNPNLEGIFGNSKTIVTSLLSQYLIGINTVDGSFKWSRSFDKIQEHISQSEYNIYVYWRESVWEVDIDTGEVSRTLDISSIFIETFNDWPNKSFISNGKLVIDFLKVNNYLLIIDLEKFDLDSIMVVNVNAFLKAQEGDVAWCHEKLYARDPMSNTLYVFE